MAKKKLYVGKVEKHLIGLGSGDQKEYEITHPDHPHGSHFVIGAIERTKKGRSTAWHWQIDGCYSDISWPFVHDAINSLLEEDYQRRDK